MIRDERGVRHRGHRPYALPQVHDRLPGGRVIRRDGKVQVDGNASVVDKETPARAMAGEDVQLSYAVEWIEAQAEEANAELTRQAAAGGLLRSGAVGGEG